MSTSDPSPAAPAIGASEKIVFGMAVFLAGLAWLLDALIDYLVFYPGTFMDLFLTRVPPHELYIRTILVVLFLGFGFMAAVLVRRRRIAELAARRERDLIRVTLQSIGDAVAVADTAGRVTMLNPEAERLSGRSLSDALGRPIPEVLRLVSETTGEPAEDITARVIENGRVIGLANHTLIVRPDGAATPIADSAAPIKGEDGVIQGVVMVFRDVSESRRAEERLRQSETSLRSVLDAVMDGLSVTDDQLRIIQVNAVMEKWYPQASPLVGRLCHQVYHGLEKPCANCPSLKAIETRERQSTVIPRIKGGRSTGWMELFSYPILDSEGRAVGVVEHIRDITDRVNAQDERERLIHRLEVQNEELERFAYTVSHDLKSPVITIKGFLGVVLKDLEIGRTDRLAVDLNRMGEAANHMGRLLDELLQLSRVGRVVTPPERVSMGRLVQDAVERVSGRLMQKPIRLLVEPTLPDVVVDRPRMVEALANLIDNAAKFMDNQEDPLIEIGHRREGGRIIYFVRDNGSGIEPRYLDRVFILFERLNPRIEGAGVGLALVKRVIETHGGRIWAQSDGPGRGATFSFTLGKPSDLDSPGSVVEKHVPPA